MKTKIGGIIQITNLARISLICLPGQDRAAAELLESFGRNHINVQFIVQCRDRNKNNLLVLCVDRDDLERVHTVLRSLPSDLGNDIYQIDPQVTCLGVYGPDFRIRPSLAGELLGTLESSGIDIQAISTSLSTFSMIIPANQIDQALALIHQNYDLP